MKKFLFLAAFLGFMSHASAGVLLEPYLGYEMETQDAKFKSASLDAGGTGSAISAGARVAWRAPGGFWVGGDAQFGFSGKFKFSDDTVKTLFGDQDYTRTQVYAEVGYDFPRVVRLWAGYGLMNELTLTPDSGSDTKFSGGSAIKVGVGFTVVPHVGLGLEYHMNTYADMDSGGSSSSVDDTYSTFNDNAVLVTVNFPFMF